MSHNTWLHMCTGFLLAITPIAVSVGCSGSKNLESQSPTGTLAIDGRIDDWAGAVRRVNGERFSLGVLNDGDHLYVSLLTTDPGIVGQVVRGGLTIWLDADGGKDKSFGIRFPLGLAADGTRGSLTGGGSASRGPGGMEDRFSASLSELEILGADGHSLRLAAGRIPGISAAATFEYGTLITELAVPLQTNETIAYAVGAAPESVIGLGLETPEIERSVTRDQGRGSGVRGGGQRGGGGRRGGGAKRGGGGQGGDGGRASLEPLGFWAKVALAG
jgi:hypothetical protein